MGVGIGVGILKRLHQGGRFLHQEGWFRGGEPHLPGFLGGVFAECCSQKGGTSTIPFYIT